MKPSEALQVHREAIRQVVASHNACNARVFGSVIHGNDTDNSDLDLLIDTTVETSLLDIAKIQNRLQKLLGISVDVLTPKALPDSFRARVLSEAQPV
jgi:predicted nucleotidyltransferase